MFTALASFLDARHQGGQWKLRIDDLDTPRNAEGASEAILRCLERFQLHWDGEVDYQTRHLQDYRELLDQLYRRDLAYVCRCSRKQLTNRAIYPGNCRDAGFSLDTPGALRVRTDQRQIEFDDILQGSVSENLAHEHGDFVIRRRDAVIAYQFAVVVDDYRQGVNHVVRGVDLLDSTPKQLYLQQLLGYAAPSYMHLPVIVGLNGYKLSKQTLAAPVNQSRPEQTLWELLRLLQQDPPFELKGSTIDCQLEWAVANWRPKFLQVMKTIDAPW